MKHTRDLMLNKHPWSLCQIRSVNGLPSMPSYEDLRMIAESISSFLNCLTLSPFNSCFGMCRDRDWQVPGVPMRKGSGIQVLVNAKPGAPKLRSFSLCLRMPVPRWAKVPETAISLHYRVKRKNRSKTWEADSKMFINFGDSFIFIM